MSCLSTFSFSEVDIGIESSNVVVAIYDKHAVKHLYSFMPLLHPDMPMCIHQPHLSARTHPFLSTGFSALHCDYYSGFAPHLIFGKCQCGLRYLCKTGIKKKVLQVSGIGCGAVWIVSPCVYFKSAATAVERADGRIRKENNNNTVAPYDSTFSADTDCILGGKVSLKRTRHKAEFCDLWDNTHNYTHS